MKENSKTYKSNVIGYEINEHLTIGNNSYDKGQDFKYFDNKKNLKKNTIYEEMK